MSSKKKYIILVSLLVVLLIVISIIIYMNSSSETSNELLIGSDKYNSMVSNKEEVIVNDSLSDAATSSNEDENINNDATYISANSNNNTYQYTEDDVLNYFYFIEKEVSDSSSFKEKFKEYFITVVDFIFYDKEIKGYTFSELSGTAKAKVIGIALKIDSIIEEYVPNYKEDISSTGSNIYTNVKEELVTLYMNIATDICKINQDDCTSVKNIFRDVKDVCSISWDFIKGLLSSGGSRIKKWYEVYSGK